MKKYIIAVIATISIGFLALGITALIPQGWIKNNAYSGREKSFNNTLPTYRLVDENNYSTFIGTATDDLMIEIAYDLGMEESSILNPIAYAEHDDFEPIYYGRYWHGYSSIIRPLLLILDQKGIMGLLSALTWGLALALGIVCFLRKQYVLLASLAISGYLTYFEIITMNLSYMPVTIIALGLSLFIVLKQEFYERNRCLIYLIAGMAVCYFDFLTFETIALTLPLLIDMTISKKWKIKDAIKSAVAWLIGYCLMNLAKFALYIAGGGTVQELAYKIEQRTLGVGTTYTPLMGIIQNIGRPRIVNTTTIWITLFVIAGFIVFILGTEYKKNIGYLFVLLIPIIRYGVLAEHSVTHYIYTYHALISTIMALIMIFTSPIFFTIERRKQKCEALNLV